LSCSDDVVPQQCVSAGRCNPKQAFEGEPEFVGRTVPPGVSSLPAERWVFRGETGADGRIYAAGTYYDNFDGDSGQGGSGAFIAADDNPVDGYLEDKAVLDSESDELGVAGAGDSDGNMYMAVTTDGAYASDASGGPGDGNLEYSAASGIPTDLSVPSDVVVAKFDDAEERQWVGVVGEGNDQSHRATGIDTDASGNPYVVGHYKTDTDAWNVFVAKFDGSGNLAWRTNLPTDHEDETFPGDPATPDNDYQDIEVKDGTVYVAADRGADATSGDGNLPATPNGHAAAMIVTLDLQGNVQQTNYVEAESGVYWRGVGVAVDSNGDTYLVGTSDSERFASDDDEHLFVAKFDASGTQKWVRGYLNVEASNVGGDWIGDIAIAPNDTLFIAGAVDTTNETVLQLDASGNQQWAVSFDDELRKYPRYTVFDLAVSDRYGVFVFGSKTFQRTTAGSYSDVMFGLIK
jgi:hypothetical protein